MASGSRSGEKAEISLLLRKWKAGDEHALEELVPIVRADLFRRARRYLAGERPGLSMRSSDIVQEAWLRLLVRKDISYKCRGDFYALASTVMRHVLVDHARRRRALRRGGGLRHISISGAGAICRGPSEDVLALDEALEKLADEDRRKAAILDMYYFGGMNIEEIAAALGLAVATVHKHKVMAEARVRREMSRRGGQEDGQ
jgi:RNA polymerase sigma factor (TIGR02999 family)